MSYVPDEQDEIIGDAMAVGGPAFVEEVHYAAMDAAEAVVPWDGNGAEPPAYRAIWTAAARKLVAERRAALRRPAVADAEPDRDAGHVPADAGDACAPGPAAPSGGSSCSA